MWVMRSLVTVLGLFSLVCADSVSRHGVWALSSFLTVGAAERRVSVGLLDARPRAQSVPLPVDVREAVS